jgi:hypothetical protein
MQGYLKIYRSFYSHWLWEERRSFSKAEAFLDLLQLAAIVPTKRMVSGSLIELEQGELVGSVRYLGDRWTWGKDKVAAFMKMLESDGMIRRVTRHGETVVILCNYKEYNGKADARPDSKSDRGQTEARQRPDNIEEGKEGKTTTTCKPARKPEQPHLPIVDAAAGKPTPNDWINPIKAKINAIHPKWTKRPTWDVREEHSLFDNRNVWLAVTDDDWTLLKAYMDAWIPEHWRNNPRDMPQPDNRLGFLNLGPNSLLSFADRWKKLQLKQPA